MLPCASSESVYYLTGSTFLILKSDFHFKSERVQLFKFVHKQMGPKMSRHTVVLFSVYNVKVFFTYRIMVLYLLVMYLPMCVIHFLAT